MSERRAMRVIGGEEISIDAIETIDSIVAIGIEGYSMFLRILVR